MLHYCVNNAITFRESDQVGIDSGVLGGIFIFTLELKHADGSRFGNHILENFLYFALCCCTEAHYVVLLPVPDAIEFAV